MSSFAPRVSVLMPTYNQMHYLPGAIQSILTQTFQDFEFFIVDDCSTDDSVAILDYFAAKDKRIRTTRNPKNLGRGASRNAALRMRPKGEYIAIMDSDDLALPERLEKQVEFLDQNPEVIVLGAQVLNVDEVNNPTPEQTILPTTHGSLVWTLTYSVPFANPVVMMRSMAFQARGWYDEHSAVEDADMWTRLVYQGRYANLPEILLHYRMPSERLVQRMADWSDPLLEVSQRFIEQLLNKPISNDASRIFRQSVFNSTNLRLTPEEFIDVIKIMHSVFRGLQEKGLLRNEDTTEVADMMFKQYRNLIDCVIE